MDTDTLEQVAEAMRATGVVGLDTEFMRERTYYPRLCLVQMADAAGEVAVVDPLAIDDLGPLAALLTDPGCVKVFHGASQDIEVLYHHLGVAPSPVFDTQMAATLAGHSVQTGYAALAKDVLDVTVHKGEAYTDWARRPLSDKQLAYAAEDARWLPGMYASLTARLEPGGRLVWLEPDFQRLADPDSYRVTPEDQWRRVKRASTLSRRALGVLQKATAWRELEAQRADRPRKWVLPDESLVEVARRAPTSVEELAELRGVSDRLSRRSLAELLAAVREGMALPDEQLPVLAKKRHAVRDADGAADLMSALVRVRARQHGVAPSLLASRSDLEALAGGEREGLDVLSGWRRGLVGEELVDLLDGKIALRVGPSGVSVERA